MPISSSSLLSHSVGTIFVCAIHRSVSDFFINYDSYKIFASAVDKKKILIDETRLLYSVVAGDYLGKIAKNHKIKIFQIQKHADL